MYMKWFISVPIVLGLGFIAHSIEVYAQSNDGLPNSNSSKIIKLDIEIAIAAEQSLAYLKKRGVKIGEYDKIIVESKHLPKSKKDVYIVALIYDDDALVFGSNENYPNLLLTLDGEDYSVIYFDPSPP